MSTTMTSLQSNNPYFQQWTQPAENQSKPISEPQRPPKANPPQRSLSYAPTTTTSPTTEAPKSPSQQPEQRRTSNPNTIKFRTRSIGWGPGVTFEREIDLSPPTDEEIIIATVRITNSFRRASVEGGDELPSRPQKRSFLRRMSTRLGSPTDPSRYTAIKMPRKDYKKYFARDKDGNYAGTEPEREWSKEDLDERFGEFQEMRLRSIPGGNEFGDGLDFPAGARSGSTGAGSPGSPGGAVRSMSAAEMSGRHGNVHLI